MRNGYGKRHSGTRTSVGHLRCLLRGASKIPQQLNLKLVLQPTVLKSFLLYFSKNAGLREKKMAGISAKGMPTAGDWEQYAPAYGNQTTDRAWTTDGLNSNQTTLDDPGTHLFDWNDICFRSRP
jgi:hypothetical protein